MSFFTQLPIKKSDEQITYDSHLLLLGSCFSENIGKQLNHFKFQTLQNPFGILFHPLAIENMIVRAVSQQKYTADDVFLHNERWHCFDAHSELSATTKEGLLAGLNNALTVTFEFLKRATHICITLGTAWVYRNTESSTIVANCHKIPQKQFTKELLSVGQVQDSLENILKSIHEVGQNAHVIFTVSPVRHLKDGFVENQRSKAHLIGAIHQTMEVPSNAKNTSYFPSYEIMMDELRDYRFYGKDMLHPNETAINYIWEKFYQTYFSETVVKTMDKVAVIQKGLLHKSFNPASKASLKFQESLQEKITYIKRDFPFMEF